MHLTSCSRRLIILIAMVCLLRGPVFAGVTASISGTVKDQSGAAIAGATVTATNLDTGIAQSQSTNNQGFYSFQSLPLGKYAVDFQQKGFRTLRRTDLILDVNSALLVDATLQVGKTSEQVEVAADALHVETITSQMGEVIQTKQMTDVPLVTRSYTDLLGLQPGVISTPSGMTGAYAGAFTSAGFPAPLVSGSLDSGALSVNGMREAANGFLLNGMLVQETGFSGAGAIPNLDSLLEFRILTNNADAEYGNYAGGVINVVTKSGTNHFHGNVFEFLRNTDFDAANYTNFGAPRGAYHQNQFGGTVGGPIIRDRMFFFADYQGNRLVEPVTEIINGAPSTALEGGNLSSVIGSLVTTNGSGQVVPTTVTGTAWASQLDTQLGQPAGTFIAGVTPYYTPGCASFSQCVFPNEQLSPTAFNPISTNMLKYILPANNAAGQFVDSSQAINLHDNKFSGRVDFNSGIGLLTAYYYFDRYNRIDPYWAGNAPLYPGFNVSGNGQTHDVTFGATKTFGTSSVNELRFGYFRLDTLFNQPSGGKGVTLASLGFASGASGAPGIYPVAPSLEGVPETDFNDYVIGVPSRPNGLIENIFQVSDNFSKVIRTHTFKFGGQYHYDQLEEDLIDNVSNGNFFFGTNFNGGVSETGVDFVDFLLGAPSSYVQGQSYPSYGRNFYLGLFAQDSWRVKPNLTFNYGLRYDVSSPFSVKYNQIQTIIPGEQSVVFPGSPTGWLFPGDPHVPSTLAPTRWNNFAPRLGLAYSFGDHEGTLGKLLGPSGTTSLRAGFGIFYTTFEGATNFNEIGDAPFGNYTGQYASTFAAPFTNRAGGTSITNLFPAPTPPLHFSASHPASGYPYDNLADFFSAFGTIGSSPAFYNHNKLPYAEEYELSIQHQITGSDLISLSYVGTQGHSLLSSKSANPGNPALCLATSGCGPGGENNIYLNGTSAVLGTRTPLNGVTLPVGTSIGASNCVQGSNGQSCVLPNSQTAIIPFGNDSYFITAGTSSYNSFQINYRHTSGRLQTLVGYTFSKSLDDSSGYGEQINPINPRLSRGLSAFDSTNNFVVSYNYLLPVDKLGGPKRLTNGWGISGITRFATGLPVTMVETDDQSLLGTSFGGPIPLAVDTPDLVGPLGITNPRTTATKLQYFSPAAFGPSALGEEGDARRRFFHGPGINNWDMALLKNTLITERVNLQFRAEFFNIWNHTQFLGPSGITGFSAGAPTAASFGQVGGTAQPRIGQLSLKFNF